MKSIEQTGTLTFGALFLLAQARLEIDFDEGVKVNYLKFKEANQLIPWLTAKED